MDGTNRKRESSLAGATRVKPAFFLVAAGALVAAAAFIAVALLLASCSARLTSAIGSDGSARFSFRAEMPAPVAAKFRKLAQASGAANATAPLFDAKAIRASIAARPGLELLEISQPDPDSIGIEASARDLEELAAAPDIKAAGLIAVTRGPGWTECRVRLGRGNAKAVTSIFPGIDPSLVDALSPPALEEDPVTPAQYRTMLNSVLGDKAMSAMESAAIVLSIGAPGTVLSSGGGSVSGSTLTLSIPIIDALVLDKPIELWLRWKSQ